MVTTCWSVKGGSGTTTVAVGLALHQARAAGGSALIVDLAGDVPAVLGLPEPTGPGALDWVAAGADVPADALARLLLPTADGLSVLPRGGCDEAVDAARLLDALVAFEEPCVVDAGCAIDEGLVDLVAESTVSLLVLRPCYLSLRRAVAAPVRPSGVVLVEMHGRALSADDVEAVLGVPVLAVVPPDPAVGRALDAGTLGLRYPRGVERALRRVA